MLVFYNDNDNENYDNGNNYRHEYMNISQGIPKERLNMYLRCQAIYKMSVLGLISNKIN